MKEPGTKFQESNNIKLEIYRLAFSDFNLRSNSDLNVDFSTIQPPAYGPHKCDYT